MKIKFCVETNWPRDKKRDTGLTGVDWTQTCEVPLVPRIGDMISVHPDDDFREVEQVFIQLPTNEITVHFKYEDLYCSAKEMAKVGWVES